MTKEEKAIREIDRPFYRYWQALYHSFFNNRLYVDVGKRWKGFGVAYFLFLMFIVTLPFSLRVILDFNRFFQEGLIQPIEQLPTLYIQNGIVSLDKPMPYLIKNKKDQVVAIVDTTGTVNTINETYPYLNTLITKNKFFYRVPTPRFFFSTSEPQKIASPIYIYPFSEHSNSVFEGKDWVKASGITGLKFFFGALIYPTIALMFFTLFLVVFLALALMGQLVAKLLKFSISYKQACRLLFVSVTPCMVLMWIILVLGWFNTGFLGLLLPVLLAVYFCYAVLSLKRESQKLVTS